jgi:hypothetical protein
LRRHEQTLAAWIVWIFRIRVGFNHRGGVTIGGDAIQNHLDAVRREAVALVEIALLDRVAGPGIGRAEHDGTPHDAATHPLLELALIGQRRISLHSFFADASIGERGDAVRQHLL